ncbi:MAG: adenylate/guanylate cyclase domain-containing protein [Gammaproteobacteria bacterium]|nr:adenylate/guanylate cyclase domain-containing protein [Gammaproteobacteria bacterium]
MSVLERRLRLITGLVLAAYVVAHLGNHAMGLVDLEAMERYRRVNALVWQNPVGTVALYFSLAVHALLALKSLYRRTTLRMPAWERCQLILGLLIPPLLAVHVIGTRLSQSLLGFDVDYPLVLYFQWSNTRYTVQQYLLVVVLWLHLVIGLHFWLRLKPWYSRALPALYAAAVLLPVLSLIGYSIAGRQVLATAADASARERILSAWLAAPADARAMIQGLEPKVLWVLGIALGAVLLAREARRQLRRRRGAIVALTHPKAGKVELPVGQSVLEALRDAGVPHASVCGGRGRCTTCRIHVSDGIEMLPAPSALEAAALHRIGAPPSVRLACQTRPSASLAITPLLPASTGADDLKKIGGVSGHEQPVAVMFVDLRASTRIGERRLPYDVVFILNQFFEEMSAALHDTGGHYAQFSGDGLMALYGLESSLDLACRQAFRGAAAMSGRLAALNDRLKHDLSEPLKIGIGIHCGDAIVGVMGPPSSPNLSAVGDNINIAARLEAQCKDYDVTLVASSQAAEQAGLDLSAFAQHEMKVRGRDGSVRVFAVPDPREIVPLDVRGPRT